MTTGGSRTNLELRLLGGVVVNGLAAEHASSLLSQPKRLALLSYLTLMTPRGPRTRERVAAMFWPDASSGLAKGALRNAIHFLREHLGPDTIAGIGDRLAVEPGRLWCDAVAFDMLLAESRPADALALYGGDLLPDLRIAGSHPFEAWLEQERESLRRRASEAAWALADDHEARGHLITAADHARRAARFSFDPESALRRLMRLLDRSGDRVAAMLEYERFTARWERDHRIRPSPETQALADAIRAGAHRPTDGGSPPIRAASERPHPRVAVLPFLRSGPGRDDGHLVTGLADGIISALSRLSGVRVMARTSVEQFRTAESRTARYVGERLDVDVVLDGSMRASQGRIALAARLTDARSQAPIWGEIYEVDRSDLLSLQIDLVMAALEALGVEPSPEEERHLTRRPTASAEAHELYLRGRTLWGRRSQADLPDAIELFERALALDPGFALPLAGLADAYMIAYPAAGVRAAEARLRAAETARRALDLDPLLGEPHATLALVRCMFERDWHGADTEFRRALELSPGYATAHHWYGAYLSFTQRRFADGAAELELARQLDPLAPTIHSDIGLALWNQGRVHQAVRKLEEALELAPDFWRAHYDLGVVAFVSGDRERGLSHLRRAWREGAFGATSGGGTGADTEGWRSALEAKLKELTERRLRTGPRAWEAALVSTLLGALDTALEWLKVAEDEGTWVPALAYLPAFEPLRERPEFEAFLDRGGVATAIGRPD